MIHPGFILGMISACQHQESKQYLLIPVRKVLFVQKEHSHGNRNHAHQESMTQPIILYLLPILLVLALIVLKATDVQWVPPKILAIRT
jgi:hypothetical protein